MVPNGVGLALRFEFLEEALEHVSRPETLATELPTIPFFEVAPENYMRRGGYVPRMLERIREHVPFLSHGLTMSLGGVDPFCDEYFGELRSFLSDFAVGGHSDHLCFSSANGVILHDLFPMPRNQSSVRHLSRRIAEAEDRLSQAIFVENISSYTRFDVASWSESEFLGELLEHSDAKLLLDVNNVYVNALNDGVDPYMFLDAIPLERVAYLHVAGHERRLDGLVIDTHGRDVCTDVLGLLSWVIERIGPKPVVLERDHNILDFESVLREVSAVKAAFERGIGLFAQRNGHAHG